MAIPITRLRGGSRTRPQVVAVPVLPDTLPVSYVGRSGILSAPGKPAGGAKIARSAGIFAQVVANADGYTNLKMPSTEIRKINENCWASVGVVSNEEHHLENYGKAGRSRWKGIRPTVRGAAMNPVDHPYGGGEGRQGRGTKRPKTMWGKVTGGRQTRGPKKYSNIFIISRRRTGKNK